MKKIYFLFPMVLLSSPIFGQDNQTDLLLKKVSLVSNADKKIDLIVSYFALPSNESEFKKAQIARRILQYSYAKKDKIAEVLALKEISFFYLTSSRNADGLAICLQALKSAEKLQNEKLVGYVTITLGFFYKDFNKSYALYQKCIDISDRVKDENLKVEAYKNISDLYLENDKVSEALKYSQKEYELTLKLKRFQDLAYTYLSFAEIHKKLKNYDLALSYYNMAILASKKINSKRQLGWAYNYKGLFFLEEKKIDSAKFCAQKAIASFEKSAQKDGILTGGKILLDIYRNTNVDSAFKYSEKLRAGIAKYFEDNNFQTQFNLKLNEELRQNKLAEEKEKLDEEKKQNIQYTFITIGILILLTIYLIISKSLFVNSKLIKFIGIVSLLIVFEFINLLIHPFLEKITHHSPILILLALVIIAGVLVPLHHKVEHLLVSKLVEKNKNFKMRKAAEIIQNSDN